MASYNWGGVIDGVESTTSCTNGVKGTSNPMLIATQQFNMGVGSGVSDNTLSSIPNSRTNGSCLGK